ncbi:MAG TPA: hypothetical protein VKU42_10570 [Candidatus Angelobacter sp.]|nr:hypothetical protein [Candidatus Angelobacter sp.]
MVPISAFPPAIPFTLHVTGVPDPVAVKVCEVPSATFAVLGETIKAAGEGVGVGEGGGVGAGVGVGEGVGVAVGVGDGVGVGVGVGVDPAPVIAPLARPLPTLPHATMPNKQNTTTIPDSFRTIGLNSDR